MVEALLMVIVLFAMNGTLKGNLYVTVTITVPPATCPPAPNVVTGVIVPPPKFGRLMADTYAFTSAEEAWQGVAFGAVRQVGPCNMA